MSKPLNTAIGSATIRARPVRFGKKKEKTGKRKKNDKKKNIKKEAAMTTDSSSTASGGLPVPITNAFTFFLLFFYVRAL